MKRLLLLFAAILMASTGMWAETVDYLYPVYNTADDPTSGIKEWKTASVNATVVTDASEQVTWNAGWYVVKGSDVTLSQGAICSGNVRLILADGAKLTATGIDDALNSTPGIQVSGDGNSLTVYGQTAQTGRLIATGKTYSAGIGGISTNGLRDGSNITINGGTVTANGGQDAAGIGSGYLGAASSNITVATILTLKAGSTENPADAIANNGGDLASSLAGKQYVTVSDAICNITANQDPNNKANYYSTFYSRTCDYQVPSGVTAYTGAVDGDVLKLTAIESGIIPAGEAVILRLTTEDNTATKKQLTLTAMTTKATQSDTNELKGTDVAMTLGANDYALSLGQNGVGFYLWSGKSIDAHKAYLTLSSGAKAFTFEFNDEPSGIKETFEPYNGTTETYNLNGMRVGKDYKGIVVVRGKKYLKK